MRRLILCTTLVCSMLATDDMAKNVATCGHKHCDWLTTASLSDDTSSMVAHIKSRMDDDDYIFLQTTDIDSPMAFSKWWHTLYSQEQFDYTTGAAAERHELAPGIYRVTGEAPENEVIPHIEAAYSADPPQYMAIACLTPSRDASGTTLASSARIQKQVQWRLPSLYKALLEFGVTYTTYYPADDGPLGKVFRSHFNPTSLRFANASRSDVVRKLTLDRPNAQVIFEDDGGISCSWTLPAFQPGPNGMTWSSSIPLSHELFYAYAGERTPWSIRIGERAVTKEEFQELRAIHTEQALSFKWQAGSMLIYNNIAFHHGRAAMPPEVSQGRNCMVAYAGCVAWARESCGGLEKTLRQDLALAHRLADRHSITESIWTHMTAKLNDRVVLMTPFGLEYSEVNASSLISVDLQTGTSGTPTRHARSRLRDPTALPLHRAVYDACDECSVSIHAHHPSLTVVSALEEGFAAVDQAFFSMLPIYYFSNDHQLSSAYDSIEERRLADAINRTSGGVVVLKNHGLLTFGRSVGDAYTRLWNAVRVADIQIKLMSICGQSAMPLTVFNTSKVLSNDAIMSLYTAEISELQFEGWRRVESKISNSFLN